MESKQHYNSIEPETVADPADIVSLDGYASFTRVSFFVSAYLLLLFAFRITVKMVEVSAPATLQAGYTFNASYGGVIFPVVVVRIKIFWGVEIVLLQVPR